MSTDLRGRSVSQPAETLATRPWPFTVRGTALRLFVTCWLVYMVHSATNIAREHYLMFAIGDHWSFRVDEYQGLHPDLFGLPGRGWHINSNPGVSMMAALPYALSRPLIDPVVARVQRARAASGATEPPAYQTPWPNSRAFFAEAWRRGLDVKFGAAAIATQALFMAPVSALMAVGMFYLLRTLFASDRAATWLTLLYAFGTPIFFRTGYLNHNLIVGYVAAVGFAALWNPWGARWTLGMRAFIAGLGGGAAMLLDYSGIVMLAGLYLYGLVLREEHEAPVSRAIQFTLWYGLGALGPIALLWGYQWASFGNPFLPAQSWMPAVAYVDQGYRGLALPMPDLLLQTLFDYRFGLFTSCPLVLLALATLWVDRGRIVPRREVTAMLLLFAAFWLFCGSVNYGRLQFNTGVRYMTSILPFLFVLSAAVLARMPVLAVRLIAVGSVTLSWCLAMHRDVERGLGVLDPILHVFVGGFELPLLTTVSRMGGMFGEIVARGVSPLPIFLLVGALLAAIWTPLPSSVRQ